MKKVVETDIAIIGGGIAGLWLLNRLRDQGYSVILLESGILGGQQTHKAQGIIHGGMKYALQGAVTGATHAIASMPSVWRECLAGRGQINLANVPVLSAQQYLWSTGQLGSKIAGFFASMALKSNTQLLTPDSYPLLFQHPRFKGEIYALDEMVVDVHSLIRELMKQHQDVIFKIDPMEEEQLDLDENHYLRALKIQANPLQALEVKAARYLFAAGGGNKLLLEKLKLPGIGLQFRPLHMVVVKHDYPYPIYAHCLGLNAVPRMTITSHVSHDGKIVWYLGGQLAEEGVKRSSADQIKYVQKELLTIFPWLDFTHAQFASFLVDRAEMSQPNGGRPDSFCMKAVNNMIITLPTKLALTPLLADEVIQHLIHSGCVPKTFDMRELRAWPIPALAVPIWDQLFS